MNFFLFAAQDVLVPGAPGDPRLSIGGALPEGLAAGASGLREYEAGGEACAALMLGEAAASEAVRDFGLRRVPFRQALGEYDEASTGRALRGVALLRALEVSRFCGACGGRLRDARPPEGEPPGARLCESCGRTHFPRISPAIIVAIRKGPRILLAHNAHFSSGRFGLIAGFVEAGESVEETAAREVREEAGIEIRDLRYAMSQSWPFPDSLMLAFTAEWASGEPRPDGDEITELRWCLASELPDVPPPGSVARKLIDSFKGAEP